MTRLFGLALIASTVAAGAQSQAGKPLRVAIAGLNHGHVSGFLYAASNHFTKDRLFTDLDKMLDAVNPEAVAALTGTYSHARVVEACAPRHIPVTMEKPLAVDMKQARAIQQASARYHTPVFVNYETTWYRSHGEVWNLLHDQKAAGEIRRMVAMDGHRGPQEIHVQPEFFAWLNDPVKNGAGALFDFGCYGPNLMTWLMDNRRPLKVTALTQTDKPRICTRVDDEATVLLEYPKAQGVIQASWDWPISRKDFEVYGATGGDILPALKPQETDSISYPIGVARGQFNEILDAARESAKTGRTIALPG